MRGIIYITAYMAAYTLIVVGLLLVWRSLLADQSPAPWPFFGLMGLAIGVVVMAEVLMSRGEQRAHVDS